MRYHNDIGPAREGRHTLAVVSVPMWNDVDVDALCSGARVVAFDLDNTLARSKKPMKDDMAERFSLLTTLIPVAVVSGGKYALVTSQITDRLTAEANRFHLHLMPTSGTRYYRWDGGAWEQVFARDLSSEDRAKAIASLERNAKAQGVWSGTPWGERIEDRGSQITFSALGQNAPVEAKEAWDPTNEKKNRLAQAVATDLPHLAVRSGGSTSVDISARGIDKSFAVQELARILGKDVHQIIFVGDRMDPDGNDYPAAVAGTRAVRVTGPADTVMLCDDIIESLRGQAG